MKSLPRPKSVGNMFSDEMMIGLMWPRFLEHDTSPIVATLL